MSAQTLGFAGLGRMGGPIASRLVAAGYQLHGFDAAGTAERLPDGAREADSATGLAGTADIVLLSVPDGAASRAVCSEIAEAGNWRTRIVVDLSTIGITAAQECAEILREAGVVYVDAPVSGGVAGAQSGSLSMMVGASEAVFEELKPILSLIARNCTRVGDEPGQGQTMKLLNNYVSATALAATCEAAVFGQKLGLDLAGIVDVLNVSSGRSAASEDKFPRAVVPGTYDFGFAGALMTKDITLYLESATDAGVPRELANASTALWQRFNAANPGADFTALHKYLKEGSS